MSKPVFSQTNDRWICPKDLPTTSCSWISSFYRSVVRFPFSRHTRKQYKHFIIKCNCYATIEGEMKKINEYRILFIGTPLIASLVLEDLIKEGFNIVGLVAQEDKPVGRKKEIVPVPTKKVALRYNIPVYQPHRIRKDYEFIRNLDVDLILTIAYGQIIPHELLSIPRYGCLNLHGSLLPKYRGAAPIQRAILEGETKTGITLMEMVDEMDAGDMFFKEEVEISSCDTYTTLVPKMAKAASKICIEHLQDYFDGKLPRIKQDTTLVTFANKILPEDEKLSVDETCDLFINHVRALSEEPGAYLYLDNKKLKIFMATKACDILIEKVGEILIKKGLFLKLKDGVVRLNNIQLEGKKRMDDVSFANGSQVLNHLLVK